MEPLPEATPTYISYGNYVNDIARLVAEHHSAKAQTSTAFLMYEKVLQYDAKMRNLARNKMPAYFSVTTPIEESWACFIPWARRSLTICFAHKMIMIHRDFIRRSFINPAFQMTRNTCIAASKTILREAQQKQQEDEPVIWIDQAFCIVAGIILCLDIIHQHTDHPEYTTHTNMVNECIAMLQRYGTTEKDGFFCIVDHGISREQVDQMFDNSAAFFNLEDSSKATVPFSAVHNAGWEKNAQIRPSTGAADQKESYQMQFSENMEGRWITEDVLPGFKEKSLKFMDSVQAVSEKLMVCFARGLGFEDDFFIKCHDVSKNDSQTVARLLHYFPTPENTNGEVFHRAGAHTDWDFLTLLFQKAGQSGLEICPGREVSTSFGYGDTWTKVDPDTESNAIICNIGDLLMSWSDDRFKSTFHRVKAPSEPGDYYGERYSIAFFNQPRKSADIQGPKKKYPMVTGGEFTRNAMQRNFKALLEKKNANLKSKITASVVAVKEVPATA
ncbi:Clavaminate synthase-like protein, partial [Aureobasidium melanogenum]